jgi:hypothetical protein
MIEKEGQQCRPSFYQSKENQFLRGATVLPKQLELLKYINPGAEQSLGPEIRHVVAEHTPPEFALRQTSVINNPDDEVANAAPSANTTAKTENINFTFFITFCFG